MEKNSQNNWKPILVIAVLIVLIGGGFLAWKNWPLKSNCTQDNPSNCNRLCESDSDCKLECGCGCISKNEKCVYTGIVCEAPSPNYDCKCIDSTCKYEYIGAQEIIITTDKTEYEQGEEVKFIIRNNTNQKIVLSGRELMIEKFKGNKWKMIRRWGVCCGKCRPVSRYEIYPNNIREFTWDQKTFACEIFGEVPEQVTEGKYRFKSKYFAEGESENIKTIYSDEFTIKDKVEDEITNWKTYRNEQYGFEIKYPSESTISETAPLEFEKNDPYYLSRLSLSNQGGLGVKIFKNSKNLSLAEFYKLIREDEEKLKVFSGVGYRVPKYTVWTKEIIVDGEEGIKWKNVIQDYYVGAAFTKSGLLFEFVAVWKEPGMSFDPEELKAEKKTEAFLDQVLSTFRFLE